MGPYSLCFRSESCSHFFASVCTVVKGSLWRSLPSCAKLTSLPIYCVFPFLMRLRLVFDSECLSKLESGFTISNFGVEWPPDGFFAESGCSEVRLIEEYALATSRSS